MRAVGLVILLSTAARAGTLEVGVGQTYTTIAAAAAAAHDNDVIEIQAGTYHEAVTWAANGLTIRGVGSRPVIDLTGMTIDNGKAIFVTDGADVTIEDLEFRGAAVTDQNGAGIRWEGPGSLTVRGCVFRGNENGILGGGAAHPENTALIELNEFVGNGLGDVGFTHSVYFGDADSVTFRGNWSHHLAAAGSDIGHLFKSRAVHNFVLYNRLTAEDTHSSYELNIPQGGEAYVIGNLLQQRVGGQRIMISFADGDGAQIAGSHLYVVNNTFVSEGTGDATFIRTTQNDTQITAINNLLVGPGPLAMGGTLVMMANLATDAPGFVDQAGYDYRLELGSPAIDVGVDPGSTSAMALAPVSSYAQPTALVGRGISGGAIDVGAYEQGAPIADDGAGAGGADAGGSTSTQPGGCCSADRDATGSLVMIAMVGLLLSGGRGRRPGGASARRGTSSRAR